MIRIINKTITILFIIACEFVIFSISSLVAKEVKQLNNRININIISI